jgi:hypothetical protein
MSSDLRLACPQPSGGTAVEYGAALGDTRTLDMYVHSQGANGLEGMLNEQQLE